MAKVAERMTSREAMRLWIAADREAAREYIQQRIVVCSETACWLWQRLLFKGNGYGRAGAWVDGKSFSWQAHALAYEAFVKPVPDGLILRHRCDVRACANPAHLEPGTQKDNMRDMRERGRSNRGSRNGRAKLTEVDVLRAFEMRAAGMTQREIAAELGVGRPAVCRILSGKQWGHVTDIAPT
jgi:hypothetical protein